MDNRHMKDVQAFNEKRGDEYLLMSEKYISFYVYCISYKSPFLSTLGEMLESQTFV